MLGVDKRHDAAHGLGLGQNLERQRRLTRGLGSIDLNNTASRHTADTQSGIEGQRAGGNSLDLELGTAVTIPHDGTLTELLLDLGLGGGDHIIALFTRRGRMNGTYGT